MIATNGYRKMLYVTSEEIPIVTLSPDRLQFLISDTCFREGLSTKQRIVLDLFVLGCTVALRFSDLISITSRNIELVGGQNYLVVKSIKTGVDTRVKLPSYAVDILREHWPKGRHPIFPKFSLSWFNIQIRLLCAKAGWTEECGKYRLRNGRKIELKTSDTRPFRFCDLASSHIMRRTAITTMLMHGVPEIVVRKISGHSATSPAFQRYINVVQSYQDNELEKHFARLSKA